MIIQTIDDLADCVFTMHQKYNERLWYRGQSDTRPPVPSLLRPENKGKDEHHLCNAFRIRATRILDHPPAKDNYSAWISLMQHYGLPTRMLDWSESPLVAAFFATEEQVECDSCIWVLRPRLLNETEIHDNHLYPVDSDHMQNLMVRSFKDCPADSEVCSNQTNWRNNVIVACHSVSDNPRMCAQQSSFTVHYSEERLDQLECSELLFKLIIPNDIKVQIREKLRALRISRCYLFPDLENLAHDLKSDKDDMI